MIIPESLIFYMFFTEFHHVFPQKNGPNLRAPAVFQADLDAVKASYDDVAKLLARNASYLRSKKGSHPWDVDMATRPGEH